MAPRSLSTGSPPAGRTPFVETKKVKTKQHNLDVQVTCRLYQYGIEIKNDYLKNDGSQSWIVISRGMNKYVNDLLEENGKSIHNEEVTATTGRPVADKTDGTIHSIIIFTLNDRCANQSISGSGMTLLLFVALMRDIYPPMSRRPWPEYYDIEAFIEN